MEIWTMGSIRDIDEKWNVMVAYQVPPFKEPFTIAKKEVKQVHFNELLIVNQWKE